MSFPVMIGGENWWNGIARSFGCLQFSGYHVTHHMTLCKPVHFCQKYIMLGDGSRARLKDFSWPTMATRQEHVGQEAGSTVRGRPMMGGSASLKDFMT